MPNNNEQIVVKPSKWKSFKDTYFLTGSIDIPFRLNNSTFNNRFNNALFSVISIRILL